MSKKARGVRSQKEEDGIKPGALPEPSDSCLPAPDSCPVTNPAPLTMPELLAELYPQGAPARVPGGMTAALQRELRRRNRLAEKGY